MKEKRIFICETCHKEFDHLTICEKHEKEAHPNIVAARHKYNKDDAYPHTIVVDFVDKRQIAYVSSLEQ